jgi:hypothetical protein
VKNGYGKHSYGNGGLEISNYLNVDYLGALFEDLFQKGIHHHHGPESENTSFAIHTN